MEPSSIVFSLLTEEAVSFCCNGDLLSDTCFDCCVHTTNFRSASIVLYCVLLPHHSTSAVLCLTPRQHSFFSFFPPLPPSDVSICTQFLRCKSFNWMDERPQPIHHRSYPLPSPLFLHHPVVNLTSDVPVSFSLFFPSLRLLPTLCPYLCPFFSLLHPVLLGPVQHRPLQP